MSENKPFLFAIIFPILFSVGLVGYLFTFKANVPTDDFYSYSSNNAPKAEQPSLWKKVQETVESNNEKWVELKKDSQNDPKVLKYFISAMSVMAVTLSESTPANQMPFELNELKDMVYILTGELDNKFVQTTKLFYFTPPPELPHKLEKIKFYRTGHSKNNATIDGRPYYAKEKLPETGAIIMEIFVDKVALDVNGKKRYLRLVPKNK